MSDTDVLGPDGGPTLRADVESMGPRPEPQPRSGDLIVERTSTADGAFSVQQVPGGPQFRASTRNEAVQLARRFAQSHAVDLWYADRGTYRLLERYRPLDAQ
jgi:hypothetical protein